MRCRLLGFASFGIAMSMAVLGCDSTSRGVGQVCDLTVADAGTYTYPATVNWNSSTCPSGVCLRPAGNPDHKRPGATCTAECESDADCAGESANPDDPLDTRCHGGFACAVPFAVGPLCCKHLCVCRDFLGSDGAQVPIACQGADSLASCQRAAGSASKVGVGAESDLYLTIAPRRKLDLVFMIDNSPSMAAKVAKLNSQLPKMVDALKDPTDVYLPDLRIAMIDSDFGTGGAYQSGACGPNDRNGGSIFGDRGNFLMPGAASCGVDPSALWLEYTRGRPTNFARDLDMGQVFGCIVGNIGTQGCEAEHQLQALTFALGGSDLHPALQNGFLRAEAYLGLIIVSDEDDCSAGTNDGMFGDKPELRGESARLRCATRAHMCKPANLADAVPGYPTTSKFEADVVECAARTDACPNGTDTSVPTACSPLADLHALAQEIKGLKKDPDEKIMVTGIFGWPLVDRDGFPDFANARYKIDRVPNPDASNNANPQIWDYWPLCYDPDHQPKVPGTFDAEAWAWGARGGLRIFGLHRRVRLERLEVQHLRAGPLARDGRLGEDPCEEDAQPLRGRQADGCRPRNTRASARLSRGLSRAPDRFHGRRQVHRAHPVAARVPARRNPGKHLGRLLEADLRSR
jgi:hypothetical protein